MSYTVFARKYRPLTFKDVLGQDHVVRTLCNAIEQDRLAQAYLFVGPRGTGKTSTSRIFAKALNCTDGPRVDFDPHEDVCVEIAEGRSLDVEEIDGASNNGVEAVRSLIEKVGYSPARGKYRIFYIDEVHMLSTNAFNALLKVLEEPPSHVKFIFATTEAHKILPTILSRCQRFDLRRIPTNMIADHLLHIAKLENVNLDSLAAHAVARAADGGMRDAQSMLDQLVAFCGSHIKEEDVLHIFGLTSQDTVSRLSSAILDKHISQALSALHEQAEVGKDLSKLLADLIHHYRNVLVYQVDPGVALRELPPEMQPILEKQAASVGNEKLLTLMDHLAEVEGGMRWAPNKRLSFEVGIIRAVQILGEASLSDVISTLGGVIAQGPSLLVPEAPPRVEPSPKPELPASVVPAQVAVLKPEPKPEPEPELEPEPEPEPVVLVADAELWQAIVASLEEETPLIASWAQQAIFKGIEGRKLRIACHPDDELAADGLQRPKVKKDIEGLALKFGGKPLDLVVELDAAVDAPVPEAEEEPEPPSPAEDETAEETGDTASIEAAFRDDPLIREALAIFEGKLIKKS